jgi:hypothetical protein
VRPSVVTTNEYTSDADADFDFAPQVTRRDPPALLLLAAFTVIAVALTFPDLTRFRTFIPGDSGDGLLTLWIIRTVETSIPHGWNALWNAPIFYPAPNTLAYSDTMLPVAIVHWPLRLVLGDVAALNLISLSAWVLSSWCTYRLARRFVAHWGAAFVAAFAYTYAVIRLVHQLHLQLVIGGALVPLVLLLLLRLLDTPTYRRGIEFGLAFAALTLTASYYGAMMGVVVAVVGAGWLLTLPRGERRRSLGPLAAAASVVAVLVLPFGVQYLRLQQHPEFRRTFDPMAGAHLDDFLAAGPTSYLLGHVPQIAPRSHTGLRLIENRLFPGMLALGFGVVGAGVLIREARRRGLRDGRTRALMLVSVAGATCLVLSFGDWFRFHGHRVFLPFVVFRHLVPGFAGIRAVSRLALAAELALVLCAAVGVDLLLARLRGRTRVLVAVVLASLVCAEAALGLYFVRVPTSRDDGGVDVALRARPHGVVVELPISGITRGGLWPFVEAPRQLLALGDGNPRVNGYSGFEPKGFDEETAKLDAFPAAAALAEARRLDVRYVVLRTRLVGTLTPHSLTPAFAADRAGRYSDATARSMIDHLPAGVAREVVRLPGAYLVELAT